MLATQLKWKWRFYFWKVIHLISKKFWSPRISGQTHFNALNCNIVDKHELCLWGDVSLCPTLWSNICWANIQKIGRCEHIGVLTLALTRRCGSLPHGAGCMVTDLRNVSFSCICAQKKVHICAKMQMRRAALCLFDVAVRCLPHCMYWNVFNAILLSTMCVVYSFLKTSWSWCVIRPLG